MTPLWDRIKDKEGDDLSITFTPVQRALLLVLAVNANAWGNQGVIPGALADQDNFDAVTSDMISKLTV